MGASVEVPSAFDTHHDDHDAQVDFFGRRLATASSDRTIRIFQINQNQTETLMSILSGHEGPVWQVAWAHPKFGSILASCSYDGTVIIWQESKKPAIEATAFVLKSPNEEKNGSLWTKAKVHRIHESSVNSISFSPHEYGLHLACASSDGKISILSQSENSEWTSQAFTAHQTGCNSVSWCPSAQSSSLLSLNFKNSETSSVEVGEMVLASGGCDNFVKIWKFSPEQKQWIQDASLQGHTDWVRDVCWQPSIGAARHLLVSCSQDNTVLLWQKNDQSSWSFKHLKPEPFADTIWRASFSEYGHLLAVSCGDNTVTIWREVPQTGDWGQVGTVDENVTEAVKISEPLAVELPESTPVPNLSYGQAETTPQQDYEPAPSVFESYSQHAEISYESTSNQTTINQFTVQENSYNSGDFAQNTNAPDTFYGDASVQSLQATDSYYEGNPPREVTSADNYYMESASQPTQLADNFYGAESSGFQAAESYYENSSFEPVDTQYQANYYNYDSAAPSTEAQVQAIVSDGNLASETYEYPNVADNFEYEYSNQNEYNAQITSHEEQVAREAQFEYNNYARDPQYEQQGYNTQTESQYNQYEQPLQYQNEEQQSSNLHENSGTEDAAQYQPDYNSGQASADGVSL